MADSYRAARAAEKQDETPLQRWAMHGFTFFGLQLAATPLLLWVAWSPMVMYLVLGNSLVAGLGAIVCYRFTAVPKPRTTQTAICESLITPR